MFDVNRAVLEAFCASLRIVNQNTGALEPWEPNAEQLEVFDLVTETLLVVILKARQVGISTAVLAYDLLFAIANPGVPITLALDTDDNAKKMLGTIRTWCERDLDMKLDVSSAHVLVLPNGSRIQAATSGSRAGGGQARTGRSGSAGLIHVSELAFWSNDQKAFQSLTSTALKGAKVIIESTATPAANLFRELWDRSAKTEVAAPGAYAGLFIPVELHAAYRSPEHHISDERWAQLQAEEGFTDREAAAWWNEQLEGRFAGDLHGLRQEYPNRPEHAFSHAVGRWIGHFVRAEPLVTEQFMGGTLRVYRAKADLDEPVAMGVDTAKGVGLDCSAIVIMGFESRDIIATWVSNTTELPAFIPVVRRWMETWKPRATSIESTGIGAAVFQEAATWGYAGLREQNTSATNGEKHTRLHRLAWSIQRGATRAGPELRLEIEGGKDTDGKQVQGSTRTEEGDFVGRDDVLNAASFALKVIEAEPWVRPAKAVDPRLYYAGRYSAERPRPLRRATGI